MTEKTMIAWACFSLYMLITIWLAIKGMSKTKTFSSFALGRKDMGPFLVGLTVAASTASTATFVINPGFVYTHGLSAFIHFAIASPLGVLFALILFSKGFRKYGEKSSALTLPHWIQQRFQSQKLGVYFAVMNLLLSITFIVLIIKGSALVMQFTLGIGYVPSLLIIVGFVFSYIFLGGTYAHAYTNAFQGFIMVGVALLIIASGLHFFDGGLETFFHRLSNIDPNLAHPLNSASPLFGNVWEVFICSFIISIGLVCQPHILLKALYLKTERDMNKYLGVASIVSLIFAGILIAGFYARLTLDPTTTQDAVMASYIANSFGPILGVFISVALLAAGMSTLDGILVGTSTIAANDIFIPFMKRRGSQIDSEKALKISRIILIIVGFISFVIALNPPQLVGLFAQMGIYGLTAASLPPITAGIFFQRFTANQILICSIIGPLVHFSIYLYQTKILGEIFNPAVSATIGIVCAFATLGLSELAKSLKGFRRPISASTP